jgi:hypothetical protein
MKELTKTYGDLLLDKRVRSEQSKYEAVARQRSTVMARYKKVHTIFQELLSGLAQAQSFYSEMGETVDNSKKNVDTFVNNRRSEGAQLLNQIERDKASVSLGQEDREREKLRQLMERLSTEPSPSSTSPSKQRPPSVKGTSHPNTTKSPTLSPHYPVAPPVQHVSAPSQSPASYGAFVPPASGVSYYPPQAYQGAATPLSEGYNPMAYPFQTPLPTQSFFPTNPTPFSGYTHASPPPAPSHNPQFLPQGYIPPPPPPRPQTTYPVTTGPYPSGPGGYAQSRPYGAGPRPKALPQSQSQSQSQSSPNDPWTTLNAWK